MSTSSPLLPAARASRRAAAALAATAIALLLHGCGSDLLLAGVGSGGSGLAEGSVSGLGSIFVDGVEFDDSQAAVEVEDAAGQLQKTEARIGQRVRVAYEGGNIARSIEVLPELVGPVTSVHGGGWLRVMNQWVRILDQPSASAPATVLEGGGYASSAGVAAGDTVEAHGHWSFDPSRAAHVLTATRLARRTEPIAAARLGGVVAAIEAGGLRLNAADGTLLLAGSIPAGLAVGSTVSAWVPLSEASAATMHASRVRTGTPPVRNGETLQLGGIADAVDPLARLITVQGVTTHLPEGVDAGALSRGDFVRLKLRREGDDWVALELQRRARTSDLGGIVELKGAVGDVDWSGPAPLIFTLRGTALRVDADTLAASSCKPLAAGSLVYVEASAPRGPGPLPVSEIACSAQVPAGATVERTGTVLAVDAGARMVTVRTGQGETITAWWSDSTFLGADPQDLLNGQAALEIRLQNGRPMLRRIRAAH